MKEMVESGACGKILHVEANYSSAGGMYYAPGMWRAKREECPGGGIAPMALHVIDTMTWILGPIGRISSICKRQAVKVELDDTSGEFLRARSGATGHAGCVFASAMNATLKFFGTRANLEARDNFKELTVRPSIRKNRSAPTLRDRRHGAARAARLRRISCANHTKFPVRPAEALHNVAVMQAIIASSDQGSAWVKLPPRG